MAVETAHRVVREPFFRKILNGVFAETSLPWPPKQGAEFILRFKFQDIDILKVSLHPDVSTENEEGLEDRLKILQLLANLFDGLPVNCGVKDLVEKLAHFRDSNTGVFNGYLVHTKGPLSRDSMVKSRITKVL